MEYKILIVEDDKEICSLLGEYLQKYELSTRCIDDFSKVLDAFGEYKPDIVLLDINLPKYDGFYWCRKIRQVSKVPIIFISARISGMDQVMALENGADDYIIKPFDIDVVIAKIKSHIRRAYGDYAASAKEDVAELDGLKYYPDRLIVSFNDKSFIITKREGVILEYLIRKYPKVVSRDFLFEKIWDDADFVEENTLSVNISRVRKRLQTLGLNDTIETIRGTGYRINKTW